MSIITEDVIGLMDNLALNAIEADRLNSEYDRAQAELHRRSSAMLAALLEENERLQKHLSAQLAGHQETARQSTANLLRANKAEALIAEVTKVIRGRQRRHT